LRLGEAYLGPETLPETPLDLYQKQLAELSPKIGVSMPASYARRPIRADEDSHKVTSPRGTSPHFSSFKMFLSFAVLVYLSLIVRAQECVWNPLCLPYAF
jgi:hypothetical protein